jgi:hypothetical protein
LAVNRKKGLISTPQMAAVATLTQPECSIFESWFSDLYPDGHDGDALRSLLEDIGIDDEPDHYTILDAAVARLLVGWRTHQFTIASTKKPSGNRDPFPSQSLLSINWTNGSVNAWPARYELFLVPQFERYVVVTSADAEPFGYRDFALDHFSAKRDVLRASQRIIVSDWETLRREYEQERWCEYWAGELVTESEASRWADQVWASDS